MPTTLAIYYATVTGNSETLARQAETRARHEGWLPLLHNLSEVGPDDLAADTFALFIVSTWGDGEPPDDAVAFWNDLGKTEYEFPGMRYAVLGLGDRDYTKFNAFARQLDERLETLGAQRLHDRIEADAQFDDTYAVWESRIFPLIAELRGAEASVN